VGVCFHVYLQKQSYIYLHKIRTKVDQDMCQHQMMILQDSLAGFGKHQHGPQDCPKFVPSGLETTSSFYLSSIFVTVWERLVRTIRQEVSLLFVFVFVCIVFAEQAEVFFW
jgi:hypothetical protein